MMETGAPSASVDAMERFRQPLVEYLVSSLEIDDKWVRILALEMLGMVGDARSAGRIRPLLADRDHDLRMAASRSMDMIRSPGSTDSRFPADSCGDCMIRHLACEALEQLRAGK
jgi:HEAT repeat protein